jgi:hypothetical protein
MQVAFFLLVLAPVLLIVLPLAFAYLRDRRRSAARAAARSGGSASGVTSTT